MAEHVGPDLLLYSRFLLQLFEKAFYGHPGYRAVVVKVHENGRAG